MSTKYSSKGTLLKRSIASVYTTVAAVRSIDGPSAEVQHFDGTSLDSGVAMEDGELTGHTAPGSLSGELFYDPVDAVHQGLTDDLLVPAYAPWRVALPDGTKVIDFSGSLRSLTPKASVGEGLLASFEIKLRGLGTYPT